MFFHHHFSDCFIVLPYVIAHGHECRCPVGHIILYSGPEFGFGIRTFTRFIIYALEWNCEQGGNKTISIITLMVAAENNDAELVCRASNAWFPSDTIEDKRIISVACK